VVVEGNSLPGGDQGVYVESSTLGAVTVRNNTADN
jgi:hypothetical protein